MSESIVFIIGDTSEVQGTLSSLIESANHTVELFDSPKDFLEQYQGQSGCLIFYIKTPPSSVLDLQALMNERGIKLPIIFISEHADVSVAVRAIKKGAFDFLTKPIKDQQLLETTHQAILHSLSMRQKCEATQKFRTQLDMLTPREHEVMNFLVQGLPSKVIARELNISPYTVGLHRSRIMKKMNVHTATELTHTMLKHGLAKTNPAY